MGEILVEGVDLMDIVDVVDTGLSGAGRKATTLANSRFALQSS